MSGSVGAYVAQVDRVLGAGQGLFPASTGPAGVGAGGEPSPPSPPARSGLNVGATGAGEQYRGNWSTISGLDAQTNGAAADGKAENQRGRSGATGVRESARTQAAAIAPATGSPAGVKLLVSTMDERLAAMEREITTTKAQNRLLATRLRQLAMSYRMAIGAAGANPMAALGGMTGGLRGLGGGMMPTLGALGGIPSMSGLSARGGSTAQAVNGTLAGLFGRDTRASGAAERAVAHARSKLGLPYVWGATGPRAYDCSGLVQDSYAKAGVALPRTTYDQIRMGTTVSRDDIRTGDLVFSNFSAPGRPEHVQMAVSPTMVIEAPGRGGHVQISSIPSGAVVKRLA